jgi:hypothetical protein
LLLHWAKTNEISIRTIHRGNAVQKLLEEGKIADLKPLEGYLKANVGKITLKDLEKAFETLIAPEKRRAYGTSCPKRPVSSARQRQKTI